MTDFNREVAEWRTALPRGAWDMLTNVLAEFPKPISRSELGARLAMDPTGDTFNRHFRSLVSKRLVTEVNGGIMYQRTS